MPLTEHLGEAAKIIDMIVDQSPEGLEVLRGSSTYTYDGNWKLQAENGADGYHVSAVHWNYAATTGRRKRPAKSTPRPRPWTPAAGASRAAATTPSRTATCCCGPTGPTRRTGRCGSGARNGRRSSARRTADWMIGSSRNLCLYPNVYLMDQFGSQIRHLPADRGGQDRGHDLLHRAQGRERRGPGAPHPPVRGLLQRQRHGHPGRPGGVPLLPEGYLAAARAVERHEPRRHALDRGRRTRTPRRSASTR